MKYAPKKIFILEKTTLILRKRLIQESIKRLFRSDWLIISFNRYCLTERIMKYIKRNEIYYADLSPVIGSEQGGVRPVLVIQNDVGNKFSPTTIVAAITSKQNKAKLPTHIEITEDVFEKDSIVLLEQIRTVDKRRLKEYVGKLDSGTMDRVNKAISMSVGLIDSVGESKNDGRTR